MYFEENWLNPIGAFHPIIRLARILISVVHVIAMSEYHRSVIAVCIVFSFLALWVLLVTLSNHNDPIIHTPHEFKDMGVFDQDVTFSDGLNEDEYCSIYDCSNGYDP